MTKLGDLTVFPCVPPKWQTEGASKDFNRWEAVGFCLSFEHAIFITCHFHMKIGPDFDHSGVRISGRFGYLVVPDIRLFQLYGRSGYSPPVVPIIAKKRKRRSAQKNQILCAPNVPITDYSILYYIYSLSQLSTVYVLFFSTV
jgi:hypothetical protein